MRHRTGCRRARAALSILALVLTAGGCGDAGTDKAGGDRGTDATVLTMANGNGDAGELQPFISAAQRLSGGTLRIEVRSALNDGVTDFERRVIDGVKDGTNDIGWVGSRAFDDLGVTSFDALHAPLLIDSYPLEGKALDSPLAGQMLASLGPLGVTGLGVLPGPLRKPLGIAPLVRPADFKGRTIAGQRSQITTQTLRALGARAAAIPAGAGIEAYDGVEQQVSGLAGNEYDNVAGFLTANVNLWPRPIVLFANPRALAALTEKQRNALKGAAQAAFAATLAVQRDADQEGLGSICRRGATVLTARGSDLAALRRAVQPVYDRLERDPQTKAAIAQISALRTQVASPPDAPACPRSAGAADGAAKATPIDGVYRWTTAAKDLRAIGSPDAVPENYGSWRWTLDRGRFTYSQRNGRAREDASGTYEVAGHEVAFTIRRSRGVYPTGAAAKPGERLTFGWSLFRDRLTLKAVKDAVSPDIYRVKPWRRSGDAPTARGSAGPAVATRTPIDGVYRVTTTKKELIATGSPDVFSENYGEWRYVFDRGQLRYTQSSEGASRWTKATYTVRGHTLTFTVTDYGGEAPNGAAEKTGEVFTFRWSLFRDRLTLRPVGGKISPDNFRLKPWRRVGDVS
jgi:TRAP-type C4-dicarboxylate transport system substrate-binding protein